MKTFPHVLSSDAFQGFMEEGLWQTAGAAPLLLRGWLLMNDNRPWHEIQAMIGSRLIGSSTPSARPDVASAFPLHQGAERSGFLLRLPPLRSTDQITLRIVTDAPEPIELYSFRAHEIPGRSALLPPHPIWKVDRRGSGCQSSDHDSALNFSIIIPVFNPRITELQECLDSLRSQLHERWEAWVIDDASTDPAVAAELERYRALDRRIHVLRSPLNEGIGCATNRGINAARGEWICFLDQDDRLLPRALKRFADEIAHDSNWEAIYSDEEKITAEGTPHSPLLKPGWSPIFLRGVMYLGHLLTVKTSCLRAIGGIDPRFDGIQDYELGLRLAEQGLRVLHLPEVLYQWRMGENSSARIGNVKGDMDQRQREAVAAHLQRLAHPGLVASTGHHRVLVTPPTHFTAPSFVRIQIATGSSISTIPPVTGDAEFLVVSLSDQLHASIEEHDLRLLLFHASIQPDRVFSPLLVTRDGAVAESGCTIAGSGEIVRVMHGFDPGADGMNGSLACAREVRTLSGCLMVMGQTTWRKLCASLVTDSEIQNLDATWLALRLPNAVVIPTARATLDADLIDVPRVVGTMSKDVVADPYWNPQFNGLNGDYSLESPVVAPSEWQFDFPLDAKTSDPRIRIIGWCLPPANADVVSARVRVGDWTIPAIVQITRPDVAAIWPVAGERRPGYEVRFELPNGHHTLNFDVQTSAEAGVWHTLVTRNLEVDLRSRPGLETDPGQLVAFQLGLHPKHPARSIPFARLPSRPLRDDWPRLSLVTPSFQQGEYLSALLESVEANDQIGLEHVIQDGGSTDSTLAVLKQNPRPNRSWISAADDGQADAIAKGFIRTQGTGSDLMAWINADDFYAPRALDFVRDYFAQHPEIDVLYGNRIVVDRQGKEINRWYLPPHDRSAIELNDYVPQETLFWRRRMWDAVGGIDTSFQFALDWDLFLRFQNAGANIVHVPKFLACFRVHDAQKTSCQMDSIGATEINLLRKRTLGRVPSAEELTYSPVLNRYLLASARAEDRPVSGQFDDQEE